MQMCKCILLFLSLAIFSACSNVNSPQYIGNFDSIQYVYGFHKVEVEKSGFGPEGYKPYCYHIPETNTLSFQILGDTLIRDISKFFNKQLNQPDSIITLFKPISLTAQEQKIIPQALLNCKLFGTFYCLDKKSPENFYYSFYKNDTTNNLLKVVHWYRVGNIGNAFFYSKDSVTQDFFKKDFSKMLATDRKFSNGDTVKLHFGNRSKH